MFAASRVVKFNDYETTRFLELYERERLLYDPALEEYRDRDAREAAARRISDALRIPGFGPKEVIAKFKNLRSSYCQELKKIADSERSGCSPEEVYKPKVFWFEQMNSYIRPFVQQRASLPNAEFPVKNGQHFSSHDGHHPDRSHSEADDFSANEQSEEAWHFPSQSAPEVRRLPVKRECSPQNDTNQQSKHRKNDYQSNYKTDDSRARVTERQISDDVYDTFGMYIASMLRSMGPPTALRMQKKITSMIVNAMCPLENPCDSDGSYS